MTNKRSVKVKVIYEYYLNSKIIFKKLFALLLEVSTKVHEFKIIIDPKANSSNSSSLSEGILIHKKMSMP